MTSDPQNLLYSPEHGSPARLSGGSLFSFHILSPYRLHTLAHLLLPREGWGPPNGTPVLVFNANNVDRFCYGPPRPEENSLAPGIFCWYLRGGEADHCCGTLLSIYLPMSRQCAVDKLESCFHNLLTPPRAGQVRLAFTSCTAKVRYRTQVKNTRVPITARTEKNKNVQPQKKQLDSNQKTQNPKKKHSDSNHGSYKEDIRHRTQMKNTQVQITARSDREDIRNKTQIKSTRVPITVRSRKPSSFSLTQHIFPVR